MDMGSMMHTFGAPGRRQTDLSTMLQIGCCLGTTVRRRDAPTRGEASRMTDRKCGNSHCDSEFVWGASLTILESWENFFISLLIFKFASDLYSIGRVSAAVAQASHIAHCNNGIPKFSALRAEDFFRGTTRRVAGRASERGAAADETRRRRRRRVAHAAP